MREYIFTASTVPKPEQLHDYGYSDRKEGETYREIQVLLPLAYLQLIKCEIFQENRLAPTPDTWHNCLRQ
jgi:hypothetical protein